MQKWLVVKPKDENQRKVILNFLEAKRYEIDSMFDDYPLKEYPYITIPYADSGDVLVGPDKEIFDFDQVVSIMQLYNFINYGMTIE